MIEIGRQLDTLFTCLILCNEKICIVRAFILISGEDGDISTSSDQTNLHLKLAKSAAEMSPWEQTPPWPTMSKLIVSGSHNLAVKLKTRT
jgi:hypothetical protein